MPPVDKLFGRGESAGKRYGFTTYDEDDIPRTELWPKRNVALTKGLSLEPSLINTPMVQENQWFLKKHFQRHWTKIFQVIAEDLNNKKNLYIWFKSSFLVEKYGWQLFCNSVVFRNSATFISKPFLWTYCNFQTYQSLYKNLVTAYIQ